MKIPAMTPRLTKLALTAHIASSVGWFGAVAGWLALSITGLISQDAQMVRATDLAMDVIARFVIVPLALASLLTGIIQSLGTTWGLFRHYLILMKLLLTVFATIVLLVKLERIRHVAAATVAAPGLHQVRIELAAHAGGGLLVLLVATILSVFKPWGRTRYGLRQQQRERHETPARTTLSAPLMLHDFDKPSGKTILLAVLFLLVLGFIVVHLAGGGLGSHGH